MFSGALMEWYLQTRTNTPINYKTILLVLGRLCRARKSRLWQSSPWVHLASQCLASILPPFQSPLVSLAETKRNFWLPASSCNLWKDRMGKHSLCALVNIWYLKSKEKEACSGFLEISHSQRIKAWMWKYLKSSPAIPFRDIVLEVSRGAKT